MSSSEKWFAVLHGYNWIVETEGKEDDENFIADCGADDEAEALAKSIVSDHNACLDIPDPWSDVPELRQALRDLYDEQNGPPLQHPRHKTRWIAAYDRAQAILVKTEI